VLKAGFRKCHRRPQHRLPLGCEPRGSLCCEITGTALSVAGKNKWLWPASWFCKVHMRACTGIKKGHNSVTVQNRTHVYMKFFHHKDLGNHLLQLCPKVMKHPVYTAVTPAQNATLCHTSHDTWTGSVTGQDKGNGYLYTSVRRPHNEHMEFEVHTHCFSVSHIVHMWLWNHYNKLCFCNVVV
jgi:hypothetical protein